MTDTVDTSVRIQKATRDRLKQLAAQQGMSLAAYLDALSQQEENRARLVHATAAFNEATERPGFAEAFDAAFGGLPNTASRHGRSTSRTRSTSQVA